MPPSKLAGLTAWWEVVEMPSPGPGTALSAVDTEVMGDARVKGESMSIVGAEGCVGVGEPWALVVISDICA